MPTANNAFNLPLSDGQIITGRTGNSPVATNITGSGTATVTNGPGTINVNSAPWNVVTVTSAPSPIIPVSGTLYNVMGSFGSSPSFVLSSRRSDDSPRQVGEIFMISTSGSTGLTIGISPFSGTTITYLNNATRTLATFSASQTGVIQLMYIGVFGVSNPIFQVISIDNVVLSTP